MANSVVNVGSDGLRWLGAKSGACSGQMSAEQRRQRERVGARAERISTVSDATTRAV